MKSLLIPVRTCRERPGTFVVPPHAVLASTRDADAVPLAQLRDHLKQRTGVRARIAWGAAEPHTVRAIRDARIKGREAYRLTVRRDGVEVAASADAGAYYGMQTLRELITTYGRRLPCCRIDDRPDFARRGVYFDVARGKVATVETVKALVERLAQWKINEFQLYIKNTFTWRRHPAIGRGFSPYTPEDILAIQAHCRKHHVRFVPSMATLSHNELTLQLPAYRHLSELPGYHGWEGGTLLCPTDPKTFRFVAELYEEFLPLFEADDMNICCDEPWELGEGRSKPAARQRGKGPVYLEFLLKVHGLCERHGKRMNAWGDIVLKYPELIPEMPKDIVMLNWDYAARGTRIPRTKEFTAAGIPVVVCPGTSSWQRHGTDMPTAIENVARFAATGRRCRAKGLLNTDWGDFGHRNPLGVSLHGFAHGAAHAWNGRAVDDAGFTDAFVKHAFGAGKDLARAIRKLGDIDGPISGNAHLYHLLVEPVRLPANRFLKRFRKVPLLAHYPAAFTDRIGQADPRRLQTVIDALGRDAFWPAFPAGLPLFEKQALLDCRLASCMDLVAAQRTLLAQRYRFGATVAAREWRKAADAMRALAAEFEALWLTRNRPSRLADNLRMMKMAEEESRGLGK